ELPRPLISSRGFKTVLLLGRRTAALKRGSSCWRSSALLAMTVWIGLSYSFSEVATPLRALENIRSARGRLAVAQAQLLIDRAMCPDATRGEQAPCQTEGSVRKVILATGDVSVPLGWLLSDRSRQAIECSFGMPELCRPTLTDQTTIKMRENNNRVMQQ